MHKNQNSFFYNNITAQLATLPKTSLSSSHSSFRPLLNVMELSNQQGCGVFFLHLFPLKAACFPVQVSISIIYCKKPGWSVDTFLWFSLSAVYFKIPFISSLYIFPLKHVLELLDVTPPLNLLSLNREVSNSSAPHAEYLWRWTLSNFASFHFRQDILFLKDSWGPLWQPYTIWPCKILFPAISSVCNIIFSS